MCPGRVALVVDEIVAFNAASPSFPRNFFLSFFFFLFFFTLEESVTIPIHDRFRVTIFFSLSIIYSEKSVTILTH